MRFTGVDIGSSFTKAVVIDSEAMILATHVLKTGMDFESASRRALEETAAKGTPSSWVVATGVGRSRCLQKPPTKTEISCIARGSYHHLPRPHVVVDIGGQDNKVVRVDEGGCQLDFKMNRKCAAGTGAFLEEIARRLDVAPEAISAMARRAGKAVEIGSYCTVFTCTEIIHHIREGASPEGILRGCYESVVKRILEMDPLDGGGAQRRRHRDPSRHRRHSSREARQGAVRRAAGAIRGGAGRRIDEQAEPCNERCVVESSSAVIPPASR